MKTKNVSRLLIFLLGITPFSFVHAVVPDTYNAPLKYAHWSVGVYGGVNAFRLPPDPVQQTDRLNASGGISIDYTENPFSGFGIEYTYSDYSRPYQYLATTGSLNARTNDVFLTGHLNLSNLFSVNRMDDQRWLKFLAEMGLGAAFYSGKLDQTTITGAPSIAAKLGLTAECRLSKVMGLFAGIEYRQYDALYMSGVKSLRNGDATLLKLGLRVKMQSNNQVHMRNLGYNAQKPDATPVSMKEVFIQEDSKRTLDEIAALKKNNADVRNNMVQLEAETKKAVQKKADEALLKAQEAKKLALEAERKAQEKESALNKRIRELEEKTKLDSIRLAEKERAQKLAIAKADSALQDKFKKMEEDLKLLATNKDAKVNMVLDNIEFKSGSSVLATSSYETLSKIVGILTANTAWNVLTVAGHTDNAGSDAVNLKLSQSRAQSVKNYLVSKGLDKDKIIAVGFGESKPIASNATPAGRQKNRRVEFEIK